MRMPSTLRPAVSSITLSFMVVGWAANSASLWQARHRRLGRPRLPEARGKTPLLRVSLLLGVLAGGQRIALFLQLLVEGLQVRLVLVDVVHPPLRFLGQATVLESSQQVVVEVARLAELAHAFVRFAGAQQTLLHEYGSRPELLRQVLVV